MTTYIAVFAMALAYVALVAAYCALRTLAKLRRATSVLTRGERGNRSLIEATEAHAAQTALLAEQLAELREHVDKRYAGAVAEARATAGAVAEAHAVSDARVAGLTNLALVRYDAFSDVAGRMSFSLALLDDHGDGVTISAIAARTDTRVYAKGVSGGKGEHELSPEEQQAVAAALHKQRGGLLNRKAG